MSGSDQRGKLWPGLGLVVSALVLGLFAGAMLGGLTVSKSEGLAGAAMVLGYGVVGAVLFLVLSIILVRRMTRRAIVRMLLFVGPLALVLLAGATWRFMKDKAEQDRQWEEEQEKYKQMKPTQQAEPTLNVMFASLQSGASDIPRSASHEPGAIGLGMASPSLLPGALYFYPGPDLIEVGDPSTPWDSLVFVQGEYYVDIAYAPPWFVPAHLKLDYDLLLLKAITISQNRIEVEVNGLDGRTAWVDRQAVQLRLWPEFILNTVAVEILDPETNPIRIKPLDHAAIMADGANALLKPLAVQGDWLMVGTSELADRIAPTGWIRWRKDGKLLVDYSLLC
ncbi:MAG: hypothetical protein IT226_14750 [Flavobacteriales bacterium]|nr:hypothetical protein [Flavobacteriales bacterium]